MNISDQINYFRQKQLELRKKEKGLDNVVPLVSHKFAGILFFKDMDVSSLDDKEILLAHTFLHSSYIYNNPKLPRDHLEAIHKNIVKEFEKRKINHFRFDELDD